MRHAWALLIAGWQLPLVAVGAAEPAKRPVNVLFIAVDDMNNGYYSARVGRFITMESTGQRELGRSCHRR